MKSYHDLAIRLLISMGSVLILSPQAISQVIIRNDNARPLVGMVEQMVFAGVPSAEIARQRFQRQLTAAVSAMNRDCGLTKEQQEKLLLAGNGDIVRLFNKVDELKLKYDRTQLDQPTFRALVNDAQPIKEAMNKDLFMDGSLFHKVWRTVATPDQLAQLEIVKRQLESQRKDTLVQSAVAWLERDFPLNQSQREQLLLLLAETTKDLQLVGEDDFAIFRLSLIKLPSDRLDEIFNQHQMKQFAQIQEQAKPIEVFLRQRGLLPSSSTEANRSQPNQ